MNELTGFLDSGGVLKHLFALRSGPVGAVSNSDAVVILLDMINREDCTGEFLDKMRAVHVDKRSPVIALVAGGTSPREIARIIESGASDCLQFPLCHEELLARVKVHGTYADCIRIQKQELEKNHRLLSLVEAAPVIEDVKRLQQELGALKDEYAALAGKYDKALADKESLEAIINTVSEHSSIVENQMDDELRQARYQAGHDPLTRLYNRLSFNGFLMQEIGKASGGTVPLSIIMFDIDHFKRINDTFGHDKGDVVLIALTQCVRKILPDFCVFARWGGEEFMILTPEFTGAQAYDLAEYLRVSVEKTRIDLVGPVTCSFGVTEFRKDESVAAFLERVDACIYEAKNNGRNQVRLG
jgi:diguanylate cyclase (GGDEF)-like protein